jgi:hypothetical protein
MSVELWKRDEYGTGSIVATVKTAEDAVTRARKEVQEINFDNALAGGEKLKSWEAYFAEPVKNGKVQAGVYYAGNMSDGKPRVYAQNKDKTLDLQLVSEHKTAFRFWLGVMDETTYYVTTEKKVVVSSLADSLLKDKIVYFIKDKSK